MRNRNQLIRLMFYGLNDSKLSAWRGLEFKFGRQLFDLLKKILGEIDAETEGKSTGEIYREDTGHRTTALISGLQGR
jgi:hypothetical protein